MARRPALARVSAIGLLFVGVSLLYVALATGGRMAWPDGPGPYQYYEQLAAAFVDGHTYLLHRPDALGAAALYVHYWDLSYFQDKLYLYWGPVPALGMALVLRLWGWRLSDGDAVVAFLVVRGAVGALLLARVVGEAFPRRAALPFVVGSVGLLLGAPLGSVLGQTNVYAAAICGGQCLLVVGMFAAHLALSRASDSAAGGGSDAAARALLVAAGVAWAMAVGCRWPEVLTVTALTFLTVVARAAIAVRHGDARARLRGLVADALCVGAPVFVGCGALAVYNDERFGSILETGITYQLGLDFHMGPRFVPTNLLSYVFNPFTRLSKFPFFTASIADRLWLRNAPLAAPEGAYYENDAGLLWSMPSSFFALWALLPVARWWRTLRARGFDAAGADARRVRLAWFCASSLALLIGFAPAALLFGVCERYLVDLSTGLAFASAVGAGIFLQARRHTPAHRVASVALAVLMAMGSAFGGVVVWCAFRR